MKSAKPIGSAEMNQLEMDVEGNVDELTLAGGALRQADNNDVETAANSRAGVLSHSLERVQEISHSSLKFGGSTKLDINSVEVAGFTRL
jgi:hypothetical protein